MWFVESIFVDKWLQSSVVILFLCTWSSERQNQTQVRMWGYDRCVTSVLRCVPLKTLEKHILICLCSSGERRHYQNEVLWSQPSHPFISVIWSVSSRLRVSLLSALLQSWMSSAFCLRASVLNEERHTSLSFHPAGEEEAMVYGDDTAGF